MEAKKLLNAPVSDWRIVISANGTYVEQKLAIRLTQAFMESMGVAKSSPATRKRLSASS